MKVRQGFVSNSSSSSFLMIVPKGEKPLIEVATAHGPLSTIAQLDTVFRQYSDYYSFKKSEDYIKCADAIKAGKVVFVSTMVDRYSEKEVLFSAMQDGRTNFETCILYSD